MRDELGVAGVLGSDQVRDGCVDVEEGELAVSEHSQPIFSREREAVKPGVPFSITSSEMPEAPAPPVRTAVVTKSARTPDVM